MPRALRNSLQLNSDVDEQALCQRILTGYAQAYSFDAIDTAKERAQHSLQQASKIPELVPGIELTSGYLRTINLAFHCDYRHLKSSVSRVQDSTKHRNKIKQITVDLIKKQSEFADRLVRLRLFHTLVTIQLDTYWDVVKWHINPVSDATIKQA